MAALVKNEVKKNVREKNDYSIETCFMLFIFINLTTTIQQSILLHLTMSHEVVSQCPRRTVQPSGQSHNRQAESKSATFERKHRWIYVLKKALKAILLTE